MGAFKDWVFGRKLVLKKTFDLAKKAPRDLDERMNSSLALSHASRFVDDVIRLLGKEKLCKLELEGLVIRGKRIKQMLNDFKD